MKHGLEDQDVSCGSQVSSWDESAQVYLDLDHELASSITGNIWNVRIDSHINFDSPCSIKVASIFIEPYMPSH
jgi:hypothetical protein